MTVGEKIRKYRMMRRMTQKQLGDAAGFKNGTSDVRINQYETNKMAPKEDIRSRIADSLNVSMAALSDIDIRSEEDIMYVFFELEEKYGMQIEKHDGRTYLSFNDRNRDAAALISYLNFWRIQKAYLLPEQAAASAEQAAAYEGWKGRFADSIQEYYSVQENAVRSYYLPLVQEAEKSIPHISRLSEFSLLMRRIMESGLSVRTAYGSPFGTDCRAGFTFYVHELLSPPFGDAEQLFARFLSELTRFSEMGCPCRTECQMTDGFVSISYYCSLPGLHMVQRQVEKFLDYHAAARQHTAYQSEMFEKDYAMQLETNDQSIEEAVMAYQKSRKVSGR